MELYNHVIYKASEQEVAEKFERCKGCDICPAGFKHTCRYNYLVENSDNYNSYCSAKRKD